MDVNDAAVLSAARLQLTEHFLCRNAVRFRRPCGGVRGRQRTTALIVHAHRLQMNDVERRCITLVADTLAGQVSARRQVSGGN